MIYDVPVFMSGVSGMASVVIPSNYQNQLNFLTIQNFTENSIKITPANDMTGGNTVVPIAPYSVVTVPIVSSIKTSLNVFWENKLNGNEINKKILLIFSVINLNLNATYAASYLIKDPIVITGETPDGQAVEGSPVLVAGKYSTNPSTRQDGDVTTIQTDSVGNVYISIQDSSIQVPVEIQAHSLTADNPMPIILTDSDIQMPVEIQSHSLLNTSPIPVYASKIEAYSISDITLEANELKLLATVDMTNKKLIYGHLMVTETGASYIHQYSNDGVTWLSSGANNITANTLTAAPGLTVGSKFYRMTIQNGATANVLTAFASTFSL